MNGVMMNGALDLPALAAFYKSSLLDDVMPFWLRHGLDSEQGGYLTAVDRDGSVIDTDKSVWFLGRGAWMFSTLYNQVEPKSEWLEAARLGITFLRKHAYAPDGKLYFTLTREGQPLRMRRYVFSEAFAAIALAAWSKASGDVVAAGEARACFERFLEYSFEPGMIADKVDALTRPSVGLGPSMIAIATAQELRDSLGDIEIRGRSLSCIIAERIAFVAENLMCSKYEALLEGAAPGGDVIDHFDGRMVTPGHGIEMSWFVLREGRFQGDDALIALGCKMLDWMLKWGWDEACGGIYYFRDVRGLPVQEYWQDMKFWWPHCEALIGTMLAWRLTGSEHYADWHGKILDWSREHFADPDHGEWFGYLHRDGSPSVMLKGNMWKGPFHLPRALLLCWKMCEDV